jgi:tRNA dimethylallyltransferase
MLLPPVICLMGPTASGKTELAVSLVEEYPLDIVSVDSALVYRGMDIGTAKPGADILARAPHRLIDIREPEDTYSAGAFVRDARDHIEEIQASGRTPLLVGGTMLYFRSLMQGIAVLPPADDAIRSEIEAEAQIAGWPALHKQLAEVDSQAAARINPNDKQRIQRALEVYRCSGKPLSAWHAGEPEQCPEFDFIKIALVASSRSELHQRIDARFVEMLQLGLIDEVATLRKRSGLSADSTSMRSVGYRQVWAHLDGQFDLKEATAKGQAATRQLAKRQLTWLRSEPDLIAVDPLDPGAGGYILSVLGEKLNKTY